MINTAQALYEFWSGFGLPAYTVGTVPDKDENGNPIKPPYITYSLPETEPLGMASHYAQVWYRDTRNTALLQKVDEIKAALKNGVLIRCEGGAVSLRPESPFAQLNVDIDPENRYAYLNMQINCYHM